MKWPTLRKLWQFAHRWIALTLGTLLIVNALTGTALLVGAPLDRQLNAHLFSNPSPHAMDSGHLDAARQRLIAEFGEKLRVVFRPPRTDTDTLRASVRASHWKGMVFIDPVTGQELGRRGEGEGWFNTLFKLHSAILLGDVGKATLAIAALGYLVLLISGIYLWWPPRWPTSFSIQWNKGLLRALFDFHRVSGVICGLIIGVSVFSGAWMAWRPIGAFVTSLSGQHPIKPPSLSADVATPAEPSDSLDRMVVQTQALMPGQMIGYVVYNGPKQPVRVRVKLDEDPHPNGLTSVWMHPQTGALLGVQRWNELDPGTHWTAYIFPLHSGDLGGLWHEILIGFAGLALAALGGSGLWLWWRRNRARAAARAQRKTAATAR